MKNLKSSTLSKALVYAAIAGMVSFGSYAYAEDINAYDNLTSPDAVRKYVNTHRYKRINKPQFVFNKSSLQSAASRGGSITGFAAPTPTLDDLKSKSPDFLEEGHHQPYILTTEKGTHTRSIVIDGTTYYYTPAETTSEGNSILDYLAGSSTLAITTTGATADNYVFKVGDSTYYTFDTTKLPTSSYTLTATETPAHWGIDIDGMTYDLAMRDQGTGDQSLYYRWSVNPDGTNRKFIAGTSAVHDLLVEVSGGTGNTNTYYKWKSDSEGNLSLTTSGASSSSSVFVAIYDSNGLQERITSGTGQNVTGDFYNLHDYNSNGNAINLNTSDSLGNVVGDFIKNYSSSYNKGGAIYNYGQIASIIGNFVDNYTSTSYMQHMGGAIFNGKTISSISGDFINNHVSSDAYSGEFYGGAIYNYSGTIDSIAGDFVNNYISGEGQEARGNGGAIHNANNGTIGSITGDFVNNYASVGSSSNGGAIHNYGSSAKIGSITGDFINNYISANNTSYGGAINNSGTIDSITGDFVNNYASVTSNSNGVFGGAIYNDKTISSISSDFINNHVSSTGRSNAKGGAVYNTFSSAIYSITGNFINNYASGTVCSNVDGGAIYNEKTISSISSDFINNYVSAGSSSGYARGGAIFNNSTHSGEIKSIKGNFVGNYAKTTSSTKKAYGGAIYNGTDSPTSYSLKAKITLAGNTFTGNYVDNNGTVTPNSIYNAGVITIADGATVTVNDGYDGLSQAQLNIGTGSTFNLSVDNGTLQTDNLGTVTNDGTINWDLDVDFSKSQKSDLITVNDSSTLGSSSVLIRSINLIVDPTSEYTVDVATADSVLANALYIAGGVLKTQGSTGWWDVTYTSTDGLLHFTAGTAPILDSLAIKVHTGDPLERTYTMSALETVGENLGDLAGGTGAKLDVDGGGFAINGGTYTGITVGENQTLTFTNVSDVTGFANDTAVTNGGSLEITGSKFTSKIANNASMTLKGTNTLNGAVSGDNGETVISTGTTTVGADLTQKDLTVESGAGLNIAANNLNITNAVKNDGTVTLNGGTSSSYVTLGSSIGNKTAESTTGKTVIDGFVNVNYNNSGDQKTIAQAIEINLGKALRANVKSVGGAVTNNGSLAIYGYEDQTDTTLNKAVTGTGTTTITRKVNVDSNIANNIVIDKFDGTSPAETHYANVTVGNNGTLGATGKTIEIKAGDGTNYNTLTIGTGSVAADSITNNSKLVLNNSTDGTLSKAINGSGSLHIATTGDNADNVVVGVSNNTITNQAITVEKGIFQLASGASLAGTSTVVVNSGAGINSINGAINDYATGSNTVTLSDGARAYVDITGNGTAAQIDKFIADADSTITLSNLNVIGVVDIPAGEVQLLSAGKVQGESLFIQSGGETVAVQGTGRNDGTVRVGMTPTSDKLNGAVYVSGAVDAITYSITGAGETVNTEASQPALGYIKDSFKIQSGDSNQKTITATGGTKGIIVDENKKLTLDNVKFENFTTGEVSGSTDSYNGDYEGIITVKSGAKLDVENSYFAVGSSDGNTKKIAIANYGTLTSDPSIYEGGVMNYKGATFTVAGDTFQNINRTGENGGAIYNEAAEGSTPAGTLYVQKDTSDNKTTFVNNTANNGGAIYNAGTATISDAVFGEVDLTDPANPVSHGNTAGTSGGAIYNIGTMSITNSSFEGNSAGYGGAIYNAGGHEINVTGSTFSNNTASNFGGAVANQGTAKFIDSNFSNNSANGGAIFNEGGGSVYIIASESNSLFENNKSGNTPNDISNLGNLYLQAKDGKTITLNGGIVGDTGTTNIGGTYNDGADKKYTGNVIIGNALTQTNLIVEDSAKMSIAANNLNITNTVQNDGTITLTGGTTDNNVTLSSSIANKTAAGTTGKTVIDGFVSIAGGKTISQAIEVLTDRRLTANANSIKGAVDNSGKVILTGGELTNNISGANGEVNITTGTVTNSASISAKSVVINSTLNTLADKVIATDGITNTGTLELTGNNLASAISGAGVTKVIGTVTNTAAKEIGNALEITNPGSLTTTTNTLTSATTTKNAGTLVFNNTADGTLNQSITDNGTHGTVEIATTNGAVIDMTGKTITNNIIKLTSGTLKTGSSTGAVDLSVADKIEANGGTLSVQDGKTGTINLGTVDTATNNKNLNIAIDADFMHNTTTNDRGIVGTADVINATVTGGNKIHVSDILLSWDTTATPAETNQHPVGTEFTAQIANDTAKGSIDLTNTTTTITPGYRDGAGNILLTYSTDTGYLTGRHSTLNDAITSSIDTKMFFMDNGTADADASITGPLTLGGTSLSITGNNHSITSTATDNSLDGIVVNDAGQTLSIANATIGSASNGFKNAIDNSVGGTVNLSNVTMTGNTTDVVNNGEGTKGVFVTGTSNIGKIGYSGATAAGQTTIGNGDAATDNVTIGEISQKNVSVLADGILNIAADKLTTTAGTDNAGKLNLSGTTTTGSSTTLASNITDASGSGETTVTGNVTVGSGTSVAQKTVNVGNATTSGILTNSGTVEADTVNANKGSNLILNGSGSTNKVDDIVVDNATLTFANGATVTDKAGTGTTTIDMKRTDTTASASSIAVNSVTADTTLENVSITNSDGRGYAITAHSENDNTSTINNAIAAATSITADNGTKLTLTEKAMNSTSASVSMGDNSTLTLANNGSAATATMQSNVTASGTAGYTVNVVNANPTDSVELQAAISGATGVNVESGLLNVDVDNGGSLGTSPVTLDDLAGVGFETGNNYTVNNAISGNGMIDDITTPTTGSLVNLTGTGSNQFTIGSTVSGATIAISNGELLLPNENNLTNANVAVASDGILNTMNGQNSSFNDTVFQNGASLKVDADVFKNSTDSFANPTELGNEYLTDISVQGLDKIYNTKSVNLTNKTGLDNLQAGAGLADLISSRYPMVVTPVRLLKGQVQQTDEGLMLQFVPTAEGYKGFNSAVLAAPIAAQMGGYLNQLHSYDEAFRNMDMYMLMTKEQRQAMKMKNHYATTSKDLIYDATTNQYENKAGWFRPYATFENVGLDNGPNVSNVAYGSYAGAESEMYDLGHGWDGMWGVYVGYNGSHQTYGYGNSIYQNGGTLGVVGMAYKNNFFTGLTINAGANGAEASTMYGNENFSMLMAGIASKSGYNWELANGKFIIQPSATISYSFVNTFDYRNAAGVNISSDPLHAIQIEPGIKFIGNLKNGWQPYASVSMVWNIMDKTHFHANEVALPDMSVKPFVKYGVGVRKSWGERFTAFFQTYFTNGGRNGVGLQAGLRWTIGKDSSKSNKANTSDKKEIKKTVIKAQNTAK